MTSFLENINFAEIIIFIIFYIYVCSLLYVSAFKLKVKNPWKSYVPILNFFYIPILAGYKKGGWVYFWIILYAVISSFLGAYFAVWLNWDIIRIDLFINLTTTIFLSLALVFWFWKIFEKQKSKGFWSLFMLGNLIPNPIVSLIAFIIFIIAFSVISFKK